MQQSRPRQCVVDLAVDLGEDAVNDQVLELLLVTYVAVERAGDHSKARGQGAHSECFEALLGDQRECLGHHALPSERAAQLLIGARSAKPQRTRHFGVTPPGGAHRVFPTDFPSTGIDSECRSR
jgi:hypothetical protein